MKKVIPLEGFYKSAILWLLKLTGLFSKKVLSLLSPGGILIYFSIAKIILGF